MNGGAGADILYGEGGADIFVFDEIPNLGVNRIKDWQDGSDKIDLSDYDRSDFADVLGISSAFNGTDTRITFGQGTAVVIENLAFADFDASDVIL